MREVINFLYVIRCLASECEDDEIVIEETLRQSYYNWMDEISEGIFKDGLEKWAAGLRSGEVAAALMNGNEKDGKLLSELKFQLMDTHYYWVKMTIPDYCIIGMN